MTAAMTDTSAKLAIVDATGRHGMSIETFDNPLELARAALYRHAAGLRDDNTSSIEDLAAEVIAQVKTDWADSQQQNAVMSALHD